MNIVHYCLGFPPYRRGGMIKYVMDLISEQVKVGHNVSMLWPGALLSVNGKVSIYKHRNERVADYFCCHSYEVINPMPVPLLDGIADTSIYVKRRKLNNVELFFKRNNVDIFHIHTFMGLPREIVETAKKLGIKIIYTTHDYFGLCPKCSLFVNDNICNELKDCLHCKKCNESALSLNKIKLLQSPIYRYLKDTNIVSKMRKRHRVNLEKTGLLINSGINEKNNCGEAYVKLQSYYIDILKKCDVLHFNSNLTKSVFSQFIETKNGRVISISHGNIVDSRYIKKLHRPVQFTFLGPCEDRRKGFFLLKEALDRIYSKHKYKFNLNVFGLCTETAPYLKVNEPYNYSELSQIMDNTDLLIVPSVWFETFGFTILEALSYGVPVLISNHVGAKDIVDIGKSGMIFDCNVNDLENSLLFILQNINQLTVMNKYIVDNIHIKTMAEHSREIEKLCYY
jgi:glycosyltransferase